MKKLLTIAAAVAVACGCLVSCNEKPRTYQLITNMEDGKQKVEKLTAENDTVALNLYLDKMSQILVENMNKKATPIKSMFIVSPEGDTLNTDKGLLQVVMDKLEPQNVQPTAGGPQAVDKKQLPMKPKPDMTVKKIQLKKKGAAKEHEQQ